MGFWSFGKKRESVRLTYPAPTGVIDTLPTVAPRDGKPTSAAPMETVDPFADGAQAPSELPQSALNENTNIPTSPEPEQIMQQPRGSAEDITALPVATELERSPHLRPVPDPVDGQLNADKYLLRGAPNAPERPQGATRSATVRSKRSMRNLDSPGLFRRKTSAARKEENIREEQIKAMSSPMAIPKRPDWESGGAQRRESKRIRSSLSRLSNPPDSTASIPPMHPIETSPTSGSDRHFRFNVGALDVFSPRPTIRHSEGTDYGTAAPRLGAVLRGKSRKEERAVYSEGALNEGKRVDQLADNLDAGTIREVMEREQKRREKKRRSDEERAMRRLQRRAEKQRAEEDQKPEDAARITGSANAEDVEMGVETPTVWYDAHMRPAARIEEQNRDLPQEPESEVRDRLSQASGAIEQPPVETARAVQLSTANISPPASPQQHARNVSNFSNLTDPSPLGGVENLETTEADKRESDMSATRADGSAQARTGGWMSLFRRGKPGSEDRGKGPPSEASFSNASRESMSRQSIPPHVQQRSELRNEGSVASIRSQSVFREDLPELPLSPPDSRLQSPEIGDGSVISIPPRSQLRPLSNATTSARSLARRSGDQSWLDSPSSSAAAGTGAIMTQSLASVDSEASWLSGKPKKSSSPQAAPGSTTLAEHFDTSYPIDEHSGLLEDNQFRRITPGPEPSWLPTTSDRYSKPFTDVETTQAESGQRETPDQITQGDVAHTPTIVPLQKRVQSHEGLLNMGDASGDHEGSISPSDEDGEGDGEEQDATVEHATGVATHARQVSAGSAKLLDIQQVDEQDSTLERATSVSYQGHARQVSAGSAKLLNLPPTPKKP